MDRAAGVIGDQTIMLTGRCPAVEHSDKPRRVCFRNVEKGEVWTYLTNDIEVLALAVAELFRSRWQVELFCRWDRTEPPVKASYGTSPIAERTRIRIAVTVYVLVAIVHPRVEIDRELFTLLQEPYRPSPWENALAAGAFGSQLHSQRRQYP